MIIKNAMVFQKEGFEQGDLYIEGDRFAESGSGEIVDASGCYAIPGLVDLHFHGCIRGDFSQSDAAQMTQMARYQARNGITAICPATMTLSEQQLAEACRNMRACGAPDAAELVGINLEGPFVSKDKLGAQNPAYVQAPDAALFRRLQKEAGGLVKLLAVAPEVEGALEMIAEIKDEVACSIAHTTADYDTAMRAFEAGARQVTHLFNAMPPFTHRAPGVIGAAFDSPSCRVELITDNVHIHPSVVRATFRLFGEERVVLISDSMMATGLEDGEYELGGLPVVVKGNTARLKEGGNIAGSVTNLMNCVRTAVKVMDIPLHTAVKAASVNPAQALGIFETRGCLRPGKVADLVLLEKEDLKIRQVFVRGTAI